MKIDLHIRDLMPPLEQLFIVRLVYLTPQIVTDRHTPIIAKIMRYREYIYIFSNRLIQLPRERNRSMGWPLYWAKAKGFLHWGYNFYYGRLSHGLYNPALDPCCGFANAGTTYSVYPGADKKPLQSIHQKIFTDALTDLRALQLLEALTNRETCMELIRDHFGEPDFFNTPDDPRTFMAFRQALNQAIKERM